MQAELEFKYRTLMDTPLDQRESNHADMEQILLQQYVQKNNLCSVLLQII
jgi:hypothetical protein